MVKNAILFIILNVFLFIQFSNGQQKLLEKTVRPVGNVDEGCLKISPIESQSCDFFKCFEKRFPCGPKYWIMNYGYKYCKKYSDPNTFSKFTPSGKAFANYTNTCVLKNLESHYKSKKPMKCKIFNDNAFKIQGQCYKDIQDTFCKVFPENKELFLKTMDREDYMNSQFMSMTKKLLSNCNPPIDLFGLMFSGK